MSQIPEVAHVLSLDHLLHVQASSIHGATSYMLPEGLDSHWFEKEEQFEIACVLTRDG